MLSWKKFLPLMLIILLLACVCAVAHADILINELMTDNGTYDNDGNAYDWIELYNNGPKDVDISGWGLTDTKKDLYSFTFPAGTKIKSGEFFLVYCCGDDINANRPAVRTYFASFKLGNSGEISVLQTQTAKKSRCWNIPISSAAFPGAWRVPAINTVFSQPLPPGERIPLLSTITWRIVR